MAQKLSTLEVKTGSIRLIRKQLKGQARAGLLKARIVGDRKSGYFVGVERNSKVIVISAKKATKVEAEIWSFEKLKQTPPTRAIALAS